MVVFLRVIKKKNWDGSMMSQEIEYISRKSLSGFKKEKNYTKILKTNYKTLRMINGEKTIFYNENSSPVESTTLIFSLSTRMYNVHIPKLFNKCCTYFKNSIKKYWVFTFLFIFPISLEFDTIGKESRFLQTDILLVKCQYWCWGLKN